MDQIDNKRRMMFVTEIDYYYIAYSIIIILKALGRTDLKYLNDISKLSFLIEVVSKADIFYIVTRCHSDYPLNKTDREKITQSYSKALLNKTTVEKVLFSLERKKLISLRNSAKGRVDITLEPFSEVQSFFDANDWGLELSRMEQLSTLIPRLTSCKVTSVIEACYEKCGVVLWGA